MGRKNRWVLTMRKGYMLLTWPIEFHPRPVLGAMVHCTVAYCFEGQSYPSPMNHNILTLHFITQAILRMAGMATLSVHTVARLLKFHRGMYFKRQRIPLPVRRSSRVTPSSVPKAYHTSWTAMSEDLMKARPVCHVFPLRPYGSIR